MIYTNDRSVYRNFFYHAWRKHLKHLPLTPVEAEVVQTLICHPEYHAFIEENHSVTEEFELEENPYIHLSLHQSIREQLRMNQPTGIKQIYQILIDKYDDAHLVEHQMMTCLAELIWQAQQNGNPIDENIYLNCLRSM